MSPKYKTLIHILPADWSIKYKAYGVLFALLFLLEVTRILVSFYIPFELFYFNKQYFWLVWLWSLVSFRAPYQLLKCEDLLCQFYISVNLILVFGLFGTMKALLGLLRTYPTLCCAIVGVSDNCMRLQFSVAIEFLEESCAAVM